MIVPTSLYTRRFLGLLFLFLWNVQSTQAFTSVPSKVSLKRTENMATGPVRSLAQHASEAVSLFNNMRAPATIIASSIVPIGFLAPIPVEDPSGEPESRFRKTLRVLYTVVAVFSLSSEVLSVVWATTAANKLTEAQALPAETVWYVEGVLSRV